MVLKNTCVVGVLKNVYRERTNVKFSRSLVVNPLEDTKPQVFVNTTIFFFSFSHLIFVSSDFTQLNVFFTYLKV